MLSTPFMGSTERLTEATSIAMLQGIQSVALTTPLAPDPIGTTYVRQGSGQAIVLLHGFDSSVLEFRRLLPRLASQAETWAIDLLGFGFTERRPGLNYSPEGIKTHLHAFWERMIAQPIVLVGASMGGAAALDFSLTYPEVVQQLVLIDGAGYTVGPAIGKYLIQPLGYLATQFLRSPKVRQDVSRKAYFDPHWASPDALQCTFQHLDQPGWQEALIAFTQSGGYGSFKSRLGEIQQPTLILWGGGDRILGTQDATQFEAAIPHSQLVWLDQCGHVPHLEKPQETAHAILEFLQK